jgi:haloacetate dehalogenase
VPPADFFWSTFYYSFILCCGVSNAAERLFPGLRALQAAVEPGVRIHTVTGGSGLPFLLLHGHPQTHAIWHKAAPVPSEHFTVVACDLRGYGDSSRPAGESTHANDSKRTIGHAGVVLQKATFIANFIEC